MNDGSGRDPNTSLRVNKAGLSGDRMGSVQQDMLKYHQHRLPIDYNTGFPITPRHGGQWDRDRENAGGITLLPTGGSETRPKNIYVMFAIKY